MKGTMMDKESQVKMAREWLDVYKDQSVTIIEWDDIRVGLAEESRKARAWDALEERIKQRIARDKTGFNSAIHYTTLQELMASLLSPPTTKDPLEELEEFVKSHECIAISGIHSAIIDASNSIVKNILTEIRRLRGMK